MGRFAGEIQQGMALTTGYQTGLAETGIHTPAFLFCRAICSAGRTQGSDVTSMIARHLGEESGIYFDRTFLKGGSVSAHLNDHSEMKDSL